MGAVQKPDIGALHLDAAVADPFDRKARAQIEEQVDQPLFRDGAVKQRGAVFDQRQLCLRSGQKQGAAPRVLPRQSPQRPARDSVQQPFGQHGDVMGMAGKGGVDQRDDVAGIVDAKGGAARALHHPAGNGPAVLHQPKRFGRGAAARRTSTWCRATVCGRPSGRSRRRNSPSP